MELRDYVTVAGFLILVAGYLFALGGTYYSLRRVISDVNDLEASQMTLEKAIYTHQADDTKHVNHLYMRSIESRLEKLEESGIRMEAEIRDGHKRIEDKLDKFVDKLFHP